MSGKKIDWMKETIKELNNIKLSMMSEWFSVCTCPISVVAVRKEKAAELWS